MGFMRLKLLAGVNHGELSIFTVDLQETLELEVPVQGPLARLFDDLLIDLRVHAGRESVEATWTPQRIAKNDARRCPRIAALAHTRERQGRGPQLVKPFGRNSTQRPGRHARHNDPPLRRVLVVHVRLPDEYIERIGEHVLAKIDGGQQA